MPPPSTPLWSFGSDWVSVVLGRPVRYGGDDLAAFETRMASIAPGWLAFDIKQTLARFQDDGLRPS